MCPDVPMPSCTMRHFHSLRCAVFRVGAPMSRVHRELRPPAGSHDPLVVVLCWPRDADPDFDEQGGEQWLILLLNKWSPKTHKPVRYSWRYDPRELGAAQGSAPDALAQSACASRATCRVRCDPGLGHEQIG